MKVLVLQLAGALVLSSAAWAHPHGQEARLNAVACNNSQVEAVADLSLRRLNTDLKDGSILGLKRITNVQKQFDDENGSVFYLTMEVFETECHALSRKLWTDCKAKLPHDAVSGECKVIFQMHNAQRIAHLHHYDCTLKPDEITVQFPGCPGCLSSQPLNDTKVIKAAAKSLEKFNRDSNFKKLFLLGKITKAASQVVSGQAYHVEFTIVESTCNKNAEDQSKCGPQNCEFAHTGYCESQTVTQWHRGSQKVTNTVSCDIFESEASLVARQIHVPRHGKEKGKEKDKKEDHNEKNDHDHEHLHPYEHHHAPGTAHGPQPATPKTTGTITYLPRDGSPDAPRSEDEKEPQAKPSPDPSIVEKEKSFIRPFPDKASASELCPGPPK